MSTVKCCYKCPDRWVSHGKRCHSTCKRYLDERAKVVEENEAIRKERELDKYFLRKQQ